MAPQPDGCLAAQWAGWLQNRSACVCEIGGVLLREAASPEGGKADYELEHTKSKVTRQCFLTDGIVTILKG